MASSNIVECPDNRDDFLTLVKSNADKIVIVKAHGTWCGPCKKIAPTVKQLFNNLPSNKLMIEMDIDECDDVASYLKISKLPTLLGYVKGEKQHIHIGADEKQVASFFKKCSGSLDFNSGF